MAAPGRGAMLPPKPSESDLMTLQSPDPLSTATPAGLPPGRTGGPTRLAEDQIEALSEVVYEASGAPLFRRYFPEGAVLMREQATGDRLYVLLNGALAIERG